MDTKDIAEFVDAELSAWRRQIDAGHPVRREQVAAMRRAVVLKASGVDDALKEADPEGPGLTLDQWKDRLGVPPSHAG